jgi:acyl-CoA thioester hydrolase
LEYGEKALIETSFHDTEAAKIIFTYKIFRLPGMQLAAEGKSIQVFIDKNRELVLNTPDFIYEWKRKWGIIS